MPDALTSHPLGQLAQQIVSDAMATAARVRTRSILWRCAEIGEGVVLIGRVYIHGSGTIRLGRRVRIDGRLVPVELHAERGAELVIGDDVVLDAGVSIESQARVTIGARCHLGAYSKVMDNNFHWVSGDRLQRPPSQPVTIDDDVHIGPRAIVLPGAWLERGVCVGAGSVVSRRVKAGLMLEGSPARVVGKRGS